MTSRKVALTAAFLALAAGGTAACDDPYDDDFADSTYEWESDAGPASGAGSAVSDSDDDSEDYSDDSDADSDDDEVFYCADEDGEIVDEDNCADDSAGPSYFLWHSTSYARGMRPGTMLDDGDYFPAGDRAARRAFKLPATGKVSNGTVKTNVVGHGSGSGLSSGGGSSGG